MLRTLLTIVSIVAATVFIYRHAFAQSDPGVRNINQCGRDLDEAIASGRLEKFKDTSWARQAREEWMNACLARKAAQK